MEAKITPLKKFIDPESLEFKDRPIFRKPKFRSTEKLKVHNKFMLALLYAFDYKTIDLANYCGVSHASVERWIYNGTYPKYISRQKLIFYFNIDEDLLFGPYSCLKSLGVVGVITEQGERLRITSNRSRRINKPLLYGLIWVYRLSTKTLAEHLQIKSYLISKILYTDYEPKLNIKIRFEALFGIPHLILFSREYRAGGANEK